MTKWKWMTLGSLLAVPLLLGLLWVGGATGVVTWEYPLIGGMTKGDILYAWDNSHLRKLAAGTAGQGLTTQGASAAPTWTSFMLGSGVGQKITRGEVVLDGTNPTQASHGLTTVGACVITQNAATIGGGLTPVIFSYATSASSNLDIYGWGFTSAATTVLLTSTNSTAVVDWLCAGT